MSICALSRILTAAAVLVTVPTSAQLAVDASGTSPNVEERVPLDVVMRLLDIESREQLTLGAMPEELARKLALSSGIDVVATVTHGMHHGFHSQVFATSSVSKTELLRALASSLQASGWTEAPSRGTWWRDGSDASHAADNWMSYCNAEGWYLSAGVPARSEGPTSLRIGIHSGMGASHCTEVRADEDRSWNRWMDAVMPTLEDSDAGVVASVLGASSSDGFRKVHARIVSETPQSVTAHIDRLASRLAAAEWAIGETMTSSRTAIAGVSLAATEGHAAAGFLIAHCEQHLPNACDVSLVLFRD